MENNMGLFPVVNLIQAVDGFMPEEFKVVFNPKSDSCTEYRWANVSRYNVFLEFGSNRTSCDHLSMDPAVTYTFNDYCKLSEFYDLLRDSLTTVLELVIYKTLQEKVYLVLTYKKTRVGLYLNIPLWWILTPSLVRN
jgi:hypothetical protein